MKTFVLNLLLALSLNSVAQAAHHDLVQLGWYTFSKKNPAKLYKVIVQYSDILGDMCEVKRRVCTPGAINKEDFLVKLFITEISLSDDQKLELTGHEKDMDSDEVNKILASAVSQNLIFKAMLVQKRAFLSNSGVKDFKDTTNYKVISPFGQSMRLSYPLEDGGQTINVELVSTFYRNEKYIVTPFPKISGGLSGDLVIKDFASAPNAFKIFSDDQPLQYLVQ